MTELCVPLAGRCIISMQMGKGAIPSTDELMIEFELCVGLIFKPLRHHLNTALESGLESHIFSLWESILGVLEELLSGEAGGEDGEGVPESLRVTMNDLATEHLQNAIVMLVSSDVLQVKPQAADDISSSTWACVLRMGIPKKTLDSWLKEAV